MTVEMRAADRKSPLDDLRYLPNPDAEPVEDDELVDAIIRRGYVVGSSVDNVRVPIQKWVGPRSKNPPQPSEAPPERAEAHLEEVHPNHLPRPPRPRPELDPPKQSAFGTYNVRFAGGPLDGQDGRLNFDATIGRAQFPYDVGWYVWLGNIERGHVLEWRRHPFGA